jgi:hypothetical protein
MMDPVPGMSKTVLEPRAPSHPLGAGGRKDAIVSDAGKDKPRTKEAIEKFTKNNADKKAPVLRLGIASPLKVEFIFSLRL